MLVARGLSNSLTIRIIYRPFSHIELALPTICCLLSQVVYIYIFFFRINMASSCTQLSLQCRRLLCSKAVACARWYCTQFSYCSADTMLPTKILNGSSASRGTHTMTWTRPRWKPQMVCFSDFTTAKHLSTGAEEGKDELSRTHAVLHKSPLLPIRDAALVTESQMPLGSYFYVVDYWKHWI